MGMFDDIRVAQCCPLCGVFANFDAQTKDLNCVMHTYIPLSNDWNTSELERKFREGLPVFRRFPLDKSADVWRNQAEQIEAEATIPEEYHGKLNYVGVIASCPKCSKYFRGKIAIQEGKLVGEIYDIQAD